jgi:DNA polymerase I-like protein with 3'-5' exonuclease and polymerase domains
LRRLVFDIETDGLLETVTKIHSLVLIDLDTGDILSCAHDPLHASIEDGLRVLSQAELIVGHNVLTFDLPAIKKLHPSFTTKATVRDTLTLSRVLWSDMETIDFANLKKYPNMPGRLMGSHALEAWGFRLNILKDDFGKSTDWTLWCPEMQAYCEQDCRITVKLYELEESKKLDPRCVELEHEFQRILFDQEQFGIRFDEEAAAKLYADLAARREVLLKQMQEVFPPRTEEMKKPGYYSFFRPDHIEAKFPTKGEAVKEAKKWGLKAGDVWPGPVRTKLHPFNPGSRDEIAERLQEKYGWKPVEFTPSGKAQISDEILERMEYPEAKVLSEYFVVDKRIGAIAEGNKAWLKLSRNGRMHGGVKTNGAVTGRCTHVNPNMSQVPAVTAPYGKECRSLFCADPGFVQIGADASGLELRGLAHFMAPYDGRAYVGVVCDGDVHSVNCAALGLEVNKTNRNTIAKTFIYAWLYGAWWHKLGSIGPQLDPGLVASLNDFAKREKYTDNRGRKVWLSEYIRETLGRLDLAMDDYAVAVSVQGKQWSDSFLERTPGLATLIGAVKAAAKSRGFLYGLDGRMLRVRSQHSALNTLLQSFGALVVKQGTVLFHRNAERRGWKYGTDFAQLLHVHDEIQLQARPEIAEEVGKLAVASFAEAGQYFNLNVPITGEYKIGRNWAETH